VEVAPKRLELLRELVPAAHVAALLVNPDNPVLAGTTAEQLLAAARSFGMQLEVLNASHESDFATVFAKLGQLHVDGLVIGGGHDFAAAGGLSSYGADIAESYRLAGVYTARILKGDKPAEPPVQQATKVEFIINLKAAKALGLNVPLPLLGRADEVIE
jgi:putative tryptophan/tyrosine transport system substrate-binding protein